MEAIPWSQRRLRLAGLPGPTRWLTMVAVTTWSLVAVIVLALGLSIAVPGGSVSVYGGRPCRPAIVVAAFVALGSAVATLVYGSFRPGWKLGWLTRILVGIVCAAFAGAAFEFGRLAGSYRDFAARRDDARVSSCVHSSDRMGRVGRGGRGRFASRMDEAATKRSGVACCGWRHAIRARSSDPSLCCRDHARPTCAGSEVVRCKRGGEPPRHDGRGFTEPGRHYPDGGVLPGRTASVAGGGWSSG